MNRLVVIVAWLLILAAGPLVQTAQAVAVSDATSLRSSATPSKTSVIAILQPAECLAFVEWIVPNNDNSSGNDHPNSCGVASSLSDFDFGRAHGLAEKSSLLFDPYPGPGQSTPLFVLHHAWKILPRK